jgi:pimeloyl-ACP methyl ester carboxylesterase
MKLKHFATLYFLLIVSVAYSQKTIVALKEVNKNDNKANAQFNVNRETGGSTAPGKLVDVGGYKLHLMIKGQGKHTIVIEAGGGSWTLFWEHIQDELAKYAKVVIYDRAGMGWSDASPYSRTPGLIADELHTALLNAGLKPPFILACHSYGGVVIKAFEKQYSNLVSGMIFYDAATEGQFEVLPPISKMVVQQVLGSLKKTGAEARLGKFTAKDVEIDSTLPKKSWENYKIHKAQPSQSDAFFNEMILFPKLSDGDILTEKINKPVCVLTAGNSYGAFAGMMPKEMLEASNVKWMELQKKLATISTNTKHMIAEKATHQLMYTAKKEMIEAAQWVMQQIK